MNLFHQHQSLCRRYFIVRSVAAGLVGLNLSTWAATAAPQPAPRILVLGDSLSAEYGLKRGTGWVALLAKKLLDTQWPGRVVNASISGDTTAGGRARLPALLTQHQPSLVVIELGGNDALRGLPLAMTQDNLVAMVRAAQLAHARVLLLGMQVPPNYGRDYAQAFANTFAQTAKTHQTALVPFVLKGIADVPDSMKWFQPDRIHPKEEAQALILSNVWPEITKGLK